jgi:hypothetical protein
MLISNISYVHYKGESSYVIAIFSLLYSMGLNVITEDNTIKGRIDLTVIVNKEDSIYNRGEGNRKRRGERESDKADRRERVL